MTATPPSSTTQQCPMSHIGSEEMASANADGLTKACIEPTSESPQSPGLEPARIQQILCPNLRIGVNQGHLKPDTQGWVSVDEVKAFLTYIGIRSGSAIQNALCSLGESSVAKPRKGYINLLDLKGQALDHGSSSGILNNPQGFSQTRLDHLLSYSRDGKTLTAADLARAANNFHKCPVNFARTKGTLLQTLELSSLLRIYGQKSTQGEYVFTFDDVHSLWQNGVFPKHWQQPKPARYGTLSSLKDFAVLLLKRMFNKA